MNIVSLSRSGDNQYVLHTHLLEVCFTIVDTDYVLVTYHHFKNGTTIGMEKDEIAFAQRLIKQVKLAQDYDGDDQELELITKLGRSIWKTIKSNKIFREERLGFI